MVELGPDPQGAVQGMHDVDSWRRMFVMSFGEGLMVRVSSAARTEAQREGELECEGERNRCGQ